MPNPAIVLSRSRDVTHRDLEDAVASALAAAGCDVLVVPHVYDLTAEHPAARRIAADGPLVVAAWLHPRAARWTLAANGLPDVHCRDLSACHSAEDCVQQILADLGATAPGGAGRIDEIDSPVDERWYPVLDRSRCTDCGQCHDFCLFGVYDVRDGQVVATRPEQCKPGCPACARVCPEGSIMFPHYTADPGIAGAPGAEIAREPIELASRLRSQRDPCPVCGCACDCERSADGTAPPGMTVCPACGCICDCTDECECAQLAAADACCPEGGCCETAGRSELDDLIDELDKLDE